MIEETGTTYLWYFPDGRPASAATSTSPEASPADAWGSSAMLYAFLEGLVGVEDRMSMMQNVQLSPRWVAAEMAEAEVRVEYQCSAANLGYTFWHKKDLICLDVRTSQSKILFHVLVPKDFEGKSVSVGGKDIEFQNRLIEKSPYVDFCAEVLGESSIKIQLKKARRNL